MKVRGLWVLPLSLVLLAGCTHLYQKKKIISETLPLSLEDIEEIRSGDEAHQRLIQTTKLYPSPELQAYVSSIGLRLARVCERPQLPYRFFVLDSEKVDLFGLGGGRVYVTRGFLDFVEVESELAGGLAHEIGHIANYRYAPAKEGRVKRVYDLLLKASEQGRGLGSPYGSGAHTGLKALGVVAPQVKRRFTPDLEKEADEHAIRYMMKGGYDPRGLKQLTERLAKVSVEKFELFVEYMKGHPPFQDRRAFLEKKLRKIDFEKLKLQARREAIEPASPYTEVFRFTPEVKIQNVPSP